MKKMQILAHKSHLFLIIMIVLCSVLMSACGVADTDITLYTNNTYKQAVLISLSADQMQMAGGVEAFEKMLDDAVLDAKDAGIKLSWRDLNTRDTSTYSYEVKTDKMEITDDSDSFTWRETQFKNRKAYEFKYSQLASLMGGFQSLTLTLHAGKILDSNGTQVNSRTVRWVDPIEAPYAIVIPKSPVSWVPLVLAIVLIVAAGLALYKLISSGKLKEWSTAGINSGKWKIQASKLGGDLKHIEQEKAGLITELGTKAWEARVSHPAYAEPYTQLESLDQQASTIDADTKFLETHLQQVRDTRSKVAAEYARQISKLQSERKDVNTSLEKSRSNQTDLEKQSTKLEQEKTKMEGEIQTHQKKLAQVQASGSPDRDKQAASLTDAIAALEKSLFTTTGRVPELQTEIANLQTEQQPLVDQIARISDQITKAQADQKAALDPIDQQIGDLEGQINAKKADLNDLRQKMTPLISSLGPLVDSARPESEALNKIYGKIDKTYTELASKTEEHDLLSTRLETSDKGAVRKFYIMVAGAVVVLVLIIILLVVAFG